MKNILILIILILPLISCNQSGKNNPVLLEIDEEKLVNKDTINSLFDDLYRFKRNYNHNYNIEKNYPQLISRIEILKDTTGIKIYSDLLRLIELSSIRKKYSDHETDSLNNRIIEIIFNKEELKEIRELSKTSFHVDSTKSLDLNMKRLVDRYKRIDFYFRKQYYFRDTLMPKFWELCPLYYELLIEKESNEKPRKDSIKEEILNYESGVAENDLFITSIIKNSNDSLVPSYLKDFSPIFEKINGYYGIYNMNPDYFGDKSMLENSNILDKIKSSNYPIFEYMQDSSIINIPDSIKIYAYSSNERVEVKPIAFGYNPDECLDAYYIYPLETISKSINKLLFSSRNKLNLEFNNFHEIDSLINKQYPQICNDCPSGISDQKTFAKLEGYDHIYFTVTSGEKIDDTDTFIRAIYYVTDNDIIRLNIKEYDAFGCPCL